VVIRCWVIQQLVGDLGLWLLLDQRLQKEFGIVELLVAIEVGSSFEPLEAEVALEPLKVLALLALMQGESVEGIVISTTLAQELILRMSTRANRVCN